MMVAGCEAFLHPSICQDMKSEIPSTTTLLPRVVRAIRNKSKARMTETLAPDRDPF